MKDENEQYLYDNYPFFDRRHLGIQQSCMAWGVSHGDGWFNILKELCDKLVAINVPEGFGFDQAKEKFGSARYYHSYYPPGYPDHDESTQPTIPEGLWKEVNRLVNEAEAKSEITCEWCGATGEMRNERGWYITLCDGCLDDRREGRKQRWGA